MGKYAKEIADVFSRLELQQIILFAEKLSIDDIKLLHLKVLPTIEDLNLRQQLKNILEECEKQLISSSKKTTLISNAVQHNQSVTEQLKSVYDGLKADILLNLNSDEAQRIFIENISDAELFALRKHFENRELNEHDQKFSNALLEETRQRAVKKQPGQALDSYREFSKEIKHNLQWESKIWQNIIKNVKQANYLEFVNRKPVEPQVTEPEVEEKKPWYSDIVNFFKTIGSAIASVFSKSESLKEEEPQERYKVKFTIDEEELAENCRKEGANLIADEIGVATIGEAPPRTRNKLDDSIRARFGMAVAQQMVHSTANDNHKKFMKVVDSLIKPEDNDSTAQLVRQAIKSANNNNEQKNLFTKSVDHVFASAGKPYLVSAQEEEILKKLVESPEGTNLYGIDLSEEDREKLIHYQENMKRGKEINHIVTDFMWSGGYIRTESGQFVKRTEKEGYTEKQKKFEQKLLVAGKKLQAQCMNLQHDQSLYIDTGLDGHSMQLAIKKVGNQYKLSTYDSSGALESTEAFTKYKIFGFRLPNPIELFRLQLLGVSGMRKNAYTITVPQEKLESETGLRYLTELIRSNTSVGWVEQREQLNLDHYSMTDRNTLGFFSKIRSLANRAEVYILYKEKFASIGAPETPTFEENLQRPQNTNNCFAKKAQSCELYELERPTYKKLRMAVLQEQKQSLINEACGPIDQEDINTRYLPPIYTEMIKSLATQVLSPSELHEVSTRLAELRDPPSPEYYKDYFTALVDMRTNLVNSNVEGKLEAIKHIDDKLNSHAKEFYQFLISTLPPRTGDIKAVFTDEVVNGTFDWNSDSMPFKMDSGKINGVALKEISDFAAALSWKAIVQLINHQIVKLNVSERSLNTDKERLSHVSIREASKKITLADLENANIVRFYMGFARAENIKIEIDVGGLRQEIDKRIFFDLVIKNKASLTNPKVMGLLDYLRSISPQIEKRYNEQVYVHQRQAFIDKIDENINKTQKTLNEIIIQLDLKYQKLDDMVQQIDKDINETTRAIAAIGPNKYSINLKNLALHLSALNKDREQLKDLQTKVENRRNELQGEEEGSSKYKISKASASLERLKNKDSDLKTINSLVQEFTRTQKLLENIEQNIDSILKEVNVVEIDQKINEGIERVNQYIQGVISNHLQTNADYKILDELAAGRMGTERDRNRDIYRQSLQERTEFYKQGKNSFLPGSVFYEIQGLNRRLKVKIEEIVERKVILQSEISNVVSDNSLSSKHDEYSNIDRYSQQYSKAPIPHELKQEWVQEMFAIWLKHESPEKLYLMQKKYEDNPSIGINQAFQHFLEQKANIKYAALKESGYPIELDLGRIKEIGWKPMSDENLKAYTEKRKKIAELIAQRFKQSHGDEPKFEEQVPKSEPIRLINKDLAAEHDKSLRNKTFVTPDVVFLSQRERETLDGSTLRFLRENPQPSPKGKSKEQCDQYYREIKNYLHKLKAHNGLENKGQRIAEFSYSSVSKIFDLPYSPPKDLILELANTMIDPYRNENDEGSINDAFIKLENEERSQILASLIKLSLAQMSLSESQKTKVNAKFYSMIKQWEQLIFPADQALSEKISQLSSSGAEPEDLVLLNEVDVALHESPVGLEGLYEGQKGLQIALADYGNEKGMDAQLRQIADRLGMRNGDALLAYQFINYYSNPKIILLSEGLNSTQGRELFSRALLAAYQNATPSEQRNLLSFVQNLKLDDEGEPCLLKSPHQVFIDEILLRCSNLDPKVFKELSGQDSNEYQPDNAESFIKALIDSSSDDGIDRLFGFAKEINLLSLYIEHVLKNEPVDITKLDTLYSKLICSNLAYQLLLDQSGEDVLKSLSESFEYTREMSLAQANINKLQDNLVDFSSRLDKQSNFFNIFKQYVEDKKFDGPPILANSATPLDIPGFISLGANRSLDVIHGIVYIGNSKLGVMPAYIQSHIAMQELGLNKLPFRPLGGGYVYTEGIDVKAFIIPSEDGSLIIQRELKTLDGTNKTLQYIPPEKIDSVPLAFRKRLNAEHFFIDSEGILYAYTSDFKPILQLTHQGKSWDGKFLDHNGNRASINFDATMDSPMIQKLAAAFPHSEMISVNQNTIYVPSLAKYIINNEETGNYLITDSFSETSSKRHLKIKENGSAYTEKVLNEAEKKEILELNEIIEKEGQEIAEIKRSDSLSQQIKGTHEKKIKECKIQIQKIINKEFFIFVPDSKQINPLEEEHLRLRQKMQEAYFEFKAGGKDKEQLAIKYEKAKEAYLEIKKALKQDYAESSLLRTYTAQEGHSINPNDFQSILHIGSIPGKTKILTHLLGANVPQSPLKPKELENLRNVTVHYKGKEPLTKEDKVALIMLIGTELQHHILERGACATGKLSGWDKPRYSKLLKEFADQVKQYQQLHGALLLDDFNELWRLIQSEFLSDKELPEFFTKPVIITPTGEKKPLSINTKTTNMPIETISARTLVQFNIYDNPKALLDREQENLEERLHGLEEYGESIQSQEDGYYYENYGLFNTDTLEKLFSVTPNHHGIGGLTKDNVVGLFQLMLDQGWIRKIDNMDNKYQLTKHPSEFYSSAKIASYLTDLGLSRNQIRTLSDRLEIFMYQTAVNGGSYSLKEGTEDELIQCITKEQEHCNLEYLAAMERIKYTLELASSEVTLADLNAAYLLNDYSSIISYFPEKDRVQVERVINNAMTRLLFYKTDLDHLNDVKNTFDSKQYAKAVAMLHTRRNYNLDQLLESQVVSEKPLSDEDLLRIEQERKMQRAFLLFESEFGHRCNSHQVNIFRGLLLDDKIDPDKIDSAQARMGFGKTTLLPLIALYKTGGNKLVRFIVPKSALETNTSDMSLTLKNILGNRAVKDDFQRYRIDPDPEQTKSKKELGKVSPRLLSLQNARDDLRKRLDLYERVIKNREVLVQAPHVRNSMECQTKIFLDLLTKENFSPKQLKVLIECISLLNEIRSKITVSVFDELDATQDPATTDVNYTVGDKIYLSREEIYPLELITQTIRTTEDKSVENLAKVLIKAFNITDENKDIFNYITSLQAKQPPAIQTHAITQFNSQIYLMRAVLTDPTMLSIFTEKEPGTDFGVWFQNGKDGSKIYDNDTIATAKEQVKLPLLISVPYSAANTPKPQGSRFDNPEVTAITTLLYYLNPKTELSEEPHLEFLIEMFRNGLGEEAFLGPSQEDLDPEFQNIFKEIKYLSEIEDPVTRREERANYFSQLGTRIKNDELPKLAFRKILARTIIVAQVRSDAGKANSNRYEQGTTHDEVIGFSGTAGDTSSHFEENMLDPAADGNMTLGIMGRKNCQATITLDTTNFTTKGEDYTTSLIKQLAASFTPDTRALIDVGGLCKLSNRAVVKEIAFQLKLKSSPLKGVIFYDDVTNTKKLLTLDEHNKETVVELTPKMVTESDKLGNYFTYYDQSHSRGADIKQMDKAHAILTLNFSVTNNDYKQAIMRMRKIIDKLLGQSFSTAVPENVREAILNDLKLPEDHTLTGNDISFWLRKKELENNLNNIALLMNELDSVIKNAILQQQAAITKLMSQSELNEKQIEAFRECIKGLNKISPLITHNSFDLYTKYGKIYGTVKKEDFIQELKKSFEKELTTIFNIVNEARKDIELPLVNESNKKPYLDMEARIIQKRQSQLMDTFIIPSATSALTEVQAETENQSESQSQSQSQSQTQTHSFSEVANEEVDVEAVLRKHEIPFEPVSIDYLSKNEEIDKLPLAHQIPHMQNLFSEKDLIRCSTTYLLDERLAKEHGEPIPPVYYFLAREDGNPKVILINQDEANLFKASPVSPPWTLYDVRAKKGETIAPITGPVIPSLKDSLLKKLCFSALRYEVTGNNIDSLGQSLNGICTLEQLQPTLNMQFKDTQNVSKDDAFFTLPEWGFYGENQQNIQVNIEQTKVQIKDKYEKRGLTIKVGEGEDQVQVFISSKLNQRILDETKKQKRGETPPNHPKLKTVIAQVRKDYKNAIEEKANLLAEKEKYTNKKRDIHTKYSDEIKALKAERMKAIEEARIKMQDMHNQGLKGVINYRKYCEITFGKNLHSMCRSKVGDAPEYGTKLYGKYHDGINGMVQFAISKIVKLEQAKLSPTPPSTEAPKFLSDLELNGKLNALIRDITNAIEKRYEDRTNYSKHGKTTMIEEMFAATLEPKGKAIEIWSKKLSSALEDQLYDKTTHWQDSSSTDPAIREKIWNDFVQKLEKMINGAKNKNLTLKEFEDILIEEVKKFAKQHEKTEAGAKRITQEIMYQLSFSFNPSNDKNRNKEANKKAIEQIVRSRALNEIKNPSEQRRDLFTRIHKNLTDKETYEINLSDTLSHPNKGALDKEEVSRAVKTAFSGQNISISKVRSNFLSDRCIEYVAGQKWLEQTLDHFKPVDGRSEELSEVDGIKGKLFPDAQTELVSLDKRVLEIDEKIKLAKANRKEQLEKLAQEYQGLPGTIEKNKEKIKKFGGEMSATNKLLESVKKILSVFTSHQVNLEQDDPVDFLDTHIDLGKTINDEVAGTAELTFMPPEFYDTHDDLNEQKLHLHGLDDSEFQAKHQVDHARGIVASSAAEVKARKCHVEYDVQLQNVTEQTVEQTITLEVSQTVRKDRAQYVDGSEPLIEVIPPQDKELQTKEKGLPPVEAIVTSPKDEVILPDVKNTQYARLFKSNTRKKTDQGHKDEHDVQIKI